MMRAARRQSIGAGIIPLALLLIGCGAASRSEGTAVYASGADLESANPLVTVHPLSRQVQRFMLFVTLAKYDSVLAPAPYFAREWSWSENRTILRFGLHSDLRWHDGTPTTAADAAFTIDAARDPATGYPRYADLADVESVSVPDDTTLLVRFTRPQARFPLILCELPIVPEHLLANVARGDMRRAPFNLDPVGNGPFRFLDRRAGQRWTFVRNENFPASMGGPPRLSRVVIAIVDEPATKFAGLVSGELDIAGISPSMASLVKQDPSLRVAEYPVLFTTAIIFNTTRPPYDDARLRRAISLSIDRERIIRAALAGYATPAAGPVPAGHPYAASDSAIRDTVAADSLLREAGWPRGRDGWREKSGRPLTLELLTVGSGDNAIEQLLQADLAQRGIRVEIRQREMGAFLSAARAARKDFDALFTGIPGDISLAYLPAMFDGRAAGGALDYAGYHTPELDAAFARARAAPDEETEREAWLKVQDLLASGMPAAWVYHARGVQGVARGLLGVRMDLRGEMVTVSRWHRASPQGVTP
jgi:peptide/nickel transport system substrate-binding protein